MVLFSSLHPPRSVLRTRLKGYELSPTPPFPRVAEGFSLPAFFPPRLVPLRRGGDTYLVLTLFPLRRFPPFKIRKSGVSSRVPSVSVFPPFHYLGG